MSTGHHWLSGQRGQQRLAEKGNQGIFEDDGNILYIAYMVILVKTHKIGHRNERLFL